MNELMIPHSPKWFLAAGSMCTPDNGLLYCSSFTVVYIPPVTTIAAERMSLTVFETKHRIKHIDCNFDWTKNKYFAIMTESNKLLVYDMASKTPVKGHTCHEQKTSTPEFGTFCFTTANQIYSVDDNVFVEYCVVSNTHRKISDFLKPAYYKIVILKALPQNPLIVAAGTKSGLILIGDLSTKSILFNLRGHDTPITSLDWLSVECEPAEKKQQFEKIPATVEPSSMVIVDDDDLFDIYSTDDNEVEFGTIRDTTSLFDDNDCTDNHEVIQNNGNFNFVEECNNLRGLIRGEGSEPQTVQANVEESKDFVVVSKSKGNVSLCEDFDESASVTEPKSRVYLASGAREPTIWIWDAVNGLAAEKVTMKSPKNSNIPNTFTVLAWLDKTTLLSNDPNGDLVLWNVKHLADNKVTVRNSGKKFDSIKGVIGLCFSGKHYDIPGFKPFFWTISIYREIICTRLDDKFKQIANYSTLSPNVNAIAECPLDLHKVAIAAVDKRICVMNLSNVKTTQITLNSMLNKIHSKVLSLAWHPKKENLIAFGTHEGQVGIFDASSSSNVPIRLKPFFAKPVYSLSWGNLATSKINETRLVLFACGDKKIAYFPESGEGKYSPHHIRNFPPSTEISCCNNLIAIGTFSGNFLVCELNDSFTIVHEQIISPRNTYISSINWNPINKNLIAVASLEKDIHIINCLNFEECKILGGHSAGIATVRWSHNSLNKLVSASFDHTVRVWDTNTLASISVFEFSNLMFAAIFSPMDDNYVICGGRETTIEIFDTRLHNDDVSNLKSKLKANSAHPNIQWSSTLEEPQKEKKKAKKVDVIEDFDSIIHKTQLAEHFDQLSVSKGEEKTAVEVDAVAPIASTATTPSVPNNSSTLLYLTNKEMNRDAVFAIMNVMDTITNSAEVLHQKLFSQNRVDVEYVVDLELKNIKSSSSASKGRIFLPQIMDKLKEEIMEKIEKKTLTEEYIALAPYVSYNFWQRTCKAYASQCLGNGFTLNAIPYLIVCHEINESIDALCKSHHFREAWIMCKLYKENDDPIFNSVFEKWTKHLEYCGNYVGTALLFVCNNDFESSLKVLNKIKNPDKEITHLIDLIREKLN